MAIYRPTPVPPEEKDETAPLAIDTGREQPMAGARRRWPAAMAALALVVSACGTSSTTDDASARGTEEGGTSAAASADDEPDTIESADAVDYSDDADGAGGGAQASEPEPTTEVAGPAVNVPAVEVLDVADGSVINLADELAGEDRALLFWFWAPH